MKLQQLRYVLEVYKQNLNVSNAADVLFTSQPGVSKQIRLLEEEIGVQIFIRQGKRIISVTEPGLSIIEIADRILRETKNIKKIGQEFSSKKSGKFFISTTSTYAKYKLPSVIKKFIEIYPDVELNIKQEDDPLAVCKLVEDGEVDLGVTDNFVSMFSDLCYLPCYETHKIIIVSQDHELAKFKRPINLKDLSKFQFVTCSYFFSEQSQIYLSFTENKINLPKIVLNSSDAEIIKKYVRLGVGVGLIDSISYDKNLDYDLIAINCNHLFKPTKVICVLNLDKYLRGFVYDFMQLFSDNLTKEKINQLIFDHINEDYSI